MRQSLRFVGELASERMSVNPSKIGFFNLAPLSIHCERAARPELNGKPFVVVGVVGNRGLVVAVSPEARHAGVRAGFTPESAKFITPQIVIVEERPAAYFEAASEAQSICERFIPLVEAESQDAFMLDLSGTDRLYRDAAGLLRTLQTEVMSKLRLPSRIGLGSSRLVARLASMRAREMEILAVLPGEESEFLADYPVRVLPGVGVRTAERLRWLGIHTVRELSRMPVQTLEAAFGPRGMDIWLAALGHDPRPKHRALSHKPLRKEVILEQIFYDRPAARAALERLVAGLGLELRRAAMQVRLICLEIRYPDMPPIYRRKRIPPTDRDFILQPTVKEMFGAAFTRRVRLRGLALSYEDLVFRDDQARFEFAREKLDERGKKLERAIDEIRVKYGVEAIGPGSWWR